MEGTNFTLFDVLESFEGHGSVVFFEGIVFEREIFHLLPNHLTVYFIEYGRFDCEFIFLIKINCDDVDLMKTTVRK